MQHVFEFELCPYAAPLVKSVTKMLPADKPKLLENLEQYSSTFFPGLENDVQYVLDGGDLLYKMGDWKKQRTYQDIADQCAKYVIRYYGNCSVVVFNGYPQKPTTKDPAHAERAKDTGIGPDFVVFPHTKLSVKKNIFLSNKRNKQSIINLIGETLERSGVTVKHVPDDADLPTAKTAIEYSRKQKTVVIGEDTDILVLLWHYCESESYSLVYQTSHKRWDIHHLIEMTPGINESILLQHTFLGCDTVSRIFGIGKSKLMSNTHLLTLCKEATKIFYSAESTKEEIENTGVKLLLAIYNKSNVDSLNKLRYKTFMDKIRGTNAVKNAEN